ncbi:MAG: ribonuclease Z [Nitrospirae bacterium]|nr:ribonuclease Z [Nitrospirota bacterium]
MKPTFHHRLLNGPFEDPCLYIRLLWEKRALMFDLGDLRKLNTGELLKITDIFVTHTHIDHFIGFDTVLRALLRSEKPLSVFGPSNIIECVEGKLKGYSWNLIKEYPLRLEVFGINNDTIEHASFYAEDCFAKKQRESKQFSGIALEDISFKVKAVCLKHDIDCMGFSMEEDFHINIDKARLIDMGLPVGPWLSDLKKAIRQASPEDREFIVNGKSYSLGELKNLTIINKGQKVSYIVDASPSEENIKKIIELVKGSDTLYSEAYFLDSDKQRAVERNHLTSKLAGYIAKKAGVKNLTVMHFSPKYIHTPDAPVQEAINEWRA